MGVRKLFPTLYNEYKDSKFVFEHMTDIDELYIDCNCLFHPQSFAVLQVYKTLGQNFLENLMILQSIKYIEFLITTLKPKSLVYLAVDGVAPRAKLKQQQCRRFKTVYDKEKFKTIYKKYNQTYTDTWSNSAISPGTKYMDKLTKSIQNYLIHKKNLNTSENKIHYIFSSTYTPGEGEHKILQYIKNNKNSKTKIIYGLDADLIFLALSSKVQNIFLFRENILNLEEIKSEFHYVSIDILTKELLNDFKSIDEFVCLGFLLGNDFLPHLESVNLNYDKSLCGFNIIKMMSSKIKIPEVFSYDYLLNLFVCLSNCEEEYFSLVKRFKKPKNYKSFTLEQEIFNYENLNFPIPDPFQFGTLPFEESKRLYNEHYNIDNTAIEMYIEGLIWNCHYYLDTCLDYEWLYTSHRSPMCQDIYKWLLYNYDKYCNIENKYKNINKDMVVPDLKPLEQLLMVLPIQTSYLLPYKAKKYMINSNSYPKTFDIDFYGSFKSWQGVPLISLPSKEEVKEIINKLNLTPEEKERNVYRREFELYI